MTNFKHILLHKQNILCAVFFISVCLMLVGCSPLNGKPDPENTVTEAETSMQAWNPNESTVEIPTITEQETQSIAQPRGPVAGERTVANLLLTAKQPLGSTMYIWGGGWNEADTAAGEDARTIGISPRWAEFAALQDAQYDYNSTKYQIRDGLDCSGYVGWLLYNVFETENNQEGYVIPSTSMAREFADRGYGTYTAAGQVNDWKAGDVMSMKGHVWIALGMCEDGSVVMLHASPPGVILCGTALPHTASSEAVQLAEEYMGRHYPDWYAKYPDCSRGYFYQTDSAQMRWNSETLTDDEGLTALSAEEVLQWLFEEL